LACFNQIPQALDIGERILQRVFMVVALVNQVPQALDLVHRFSRQIDGVCRVPLGRICPQSV
jgi:hypothetical protein